MKSVEFLVYLPYSLCLVFIFCYSLVQLQLTWLYLRAPKYKPASISPPASWPRVTVQLPLYNELHVVERLIDAIMAFDYPKDKLQVQVLDDSTDDTSKLAQKKVNYYSTLGYNITLINRPERKNYKAGALHYGLETATGEFIAIFDADFLPNSDFLKKTIAAFNAPEIGVVQTRWTHINKNYSWLTQLQAFGLDAHFTIEQVGRNTGKHFINFNGTAGVWRKSCILDAGGWQADTLTEDLDLSYRAQLRHWKFKYIEQIEAPAELPATMPALKSQQFRWTKGAAENVRKNLFRLLASDQPLLSKVNGTFHLLNSTVFICVLVSALLSIPVLVLNQNNPIWPGFLNAGILYFISVSSLILFYLVSFWAINKPSLGTILSFIPRFFFFLSMSMGLSLHNSIAVAEGYLGKKTPFIRTPKFNIISRRDSWKTSRYAQHNIPLLTLLELLLCIYFIGGIYLTFYFQDFGMLPLFLMLSFGYGSVFYLSIKQRG